MKLEKFDRELDAELEIPRGIATIIGGIIGLHLVLGGFVQITDLQYHDENNPYVPSDGWTPLVIGAVMILLTLAFWVRRFILLRRLRQISVPPGTLPASPSPLGQNVVRINFRRDQPAR